MKNPAPAAALLALLLAACGTVPVAQDTRAPSVSLERIASVTHEGPITLTATVSDDTGISRVEFYDGGQKIAESSAGPFEAEVFIAAYHNGVKTFSAHAYDAAGNHAWSENLKVQIAIPHTMLCLDASFRLRAQGA